MKVNTSKDNDAAKMMNPNWRKRCRMPTERRMRIRRRLAQDAHHRIRGDGDEVKGDLWERLLPFRSRREEASRSSRSSNS